MVYLLDALQPKDEITAERGLEVDGIYIPLGATLTIKSLRASWRESDLRRELKLKFMLSEQGRE